MSDWRKTHQDKLVSLIGYLEAYGPLDCVEPVRAALVEIDRLTKARDALIEQLAQCRRDYDGLVLVLKEDVEMRRMKSEAQ